MIYADKLQPVLSHGTHHCHTHMTSKIPELSSMLELRCYQAPTLSLVYSIVFLCILQFLTCAYLMFQSCVLSCASIHVYIALLCSLSHPCILRLLAMFSDSVYKTLYHVCIQHVQVLLWLLFSLSTQPLVTQTSLCQILKTPYSVFWPYTLCQGDVRVSGDGHKAVVRGMWGAYWCWMVGT